MVEVRYRDRLGNNLFQYALGRLLAEDLGFALQADPIPGFPETGTAVLGAVHDSPVQELGGNLIDLAAVLRDKTPRRILLNGWFQRHEYYTSYRERIRQWLVMDPAHDTPCENADVVVNVRRTDYIGLGWALPFSYYEEAIRQALPQGGRVSIVTDDAHDTFFRRFRQWNPSFFKGTPLQQLSYMTNAPRLVMSASTFSWWPAFLGQAEMVVCPVPSFGPWAQDGGHEINLSETEGFLRIPVRTAYITNWAEHGYQRFRSYRARGSQWLNDHLGTRFPVAKY